MNNKILCNICKSDSNHIFTKTILKKYDVNYYLCTCCGYIFTEKPFWLDEAYSEAISDMDTGIVSRNNRISKILSVYLFFIFGSSENYVDYAGGYGLLVRLLRDNGFNIDWYDKYCRNLFSKEYIASDKKYNGVIAIEVLEHIYNPLNLLKELISNYQTKTLIFTTEIYKKDITEISSWHYLAPQTGQHISFMQYSTLEMIAKKLKLYLYTDGYIHILTEKRLTLISQAIMKNRFLLYSAYIIFRIIKRFRE